MISVANPDRLLLQFFGVLQVLGMKLLRRDVVIGIERDLRLFLLNQGGPAVAKIEIKTDAGGNNGHEQYKLDDLGGLRHCHERCWMSRIQFRIAEKTTFSQSYVL